MKISFDIDCTPEEARTFFGLPDLQPLHDVYLDRMKTAMTEGITAADWQRMMQNWAPGIAGAARRAGQPQGYARRDDTAPERVGDRLEITPRRQVRIAPVLVLGILHHAGRNARRLQAVHRLVGIAPGRPRGDDLIQRRLMHQPGGGLAAGGGGDDGGGGEAASVTTPTVLPRSDAEWIASAR